MQVDALIIMDMKLFGKEGRSEQPLADVNWL